MEKCYAINLLHVSGSNHGLQENHPPLGRKGVLSVEGGRFVQLCREDGRWGLVGRSRQSGRGGFLRRFWAEIYAHFDMTANTSSPV